MRSFCTFILLIFGAISLYAQSASLEIPGSKYGDYLVKVKMKNDTVFTFVSSIYEDKQTGKPYVFRNNCEQLNAIDTKEIELKDEDGNIFKGISADGMWLFPVIEGKMGLFKADPGKSTLKNYYLMKDNKAIAYNKVNFKNAFSDGNEDSKRKINKVFLIRTVQTVTLVAGLGTLAAALFAPLGDNYENAYAGVVGLALIVAAPLLPKVAVNKLEQAVEAYNR